MSPVDPRLFLNSAAKYGAAAANPGMIGKTYDPSIGYLRPQQGYVAQPQGPSPVTGLVQQAAPSLVKSGLQSLGSSLFGGGGAAAAGAPVAPIVEGATAVPAAGALGTGTLGAIGGFALPAAAAGYAGFRALSDYNKLKENPSFGTGFSNAIKNPANIPLNAMTFGGYSLAQGLLGGGMDMFGSSKSPDQKQRDRDRSFLQKQGLFGDNYQYTNPSGSSFDFGKDGGAKLTNAAGAQRGYREVDMTNPLASQAIDLTNPLGELISNGRSDNARSGWTGTLANAALAGGDVLKNARAMYDKMNISKSEAESVIGRLAQQKKITEEEKNVYLSNIGKVFAGDPQGANAAASTKGASVAPSTAPVRSGGYDPNINYILPRPKQPQAPSSWLQLGEAAGGNILSGIGKTVGPQIGDWLGSLF